MKNEVLLPGAKSNLPKFLLYANISCQLKFRNVMNVIMKHLVKRSKEYG